MGMRQFNICVMIIIGVLAASCSKSSSTCTSTSTSADCTVGAVPGSDPSLLQLAFADSFFFDPNTGAWTTIPATSLSAGQISTTVPVYSSYLNLSSTASLNSALAASSQKSASAASKSEVPYIEFAAKDGVTYLYRYQKFNSQGVQVVDFQGTVSTSGNRAILPLNNSTFNNRYYDSSTTVGSRFKNVIQITAESNKKAGSIYQIQYQSIFSVENIDFNLVYSDAMKAFSLSNRWSYYNNSSNTGPNKKLDFVTLKDTTGNPTSVPVDARVLFYAPPVLTITEQVFFELPFQGDLFQKSGTVVPDRGDQFFVATIPLSSSSDFNMNVALGGIKLAKNSLAYTALQFPAGNTFDVGFSYDLTPNVAYGSQAGGGDPFSNGLLYPLKPVCYELKNQTYVPWVKEPVRDTALAHGNYFGICDLDQTAEINPGTASPTSIDTWHNFFSYAPYRADKNELGHMFGIKSVTFTLSACMKVQIKASTDVNWTTKTTGGSNCGFSSADSTWTFVTAEQSFTIFDNTAPFANIKDLNSILARFQSSSTTSYPSMKFNNENLNGVTIRHIY
jgi:hypothetical protein